MRWFIAAICLALALAQAALGQINFPSTKPTASIVTIVTDGISEPNSLAAQALSEITVALEKESDLRVLNVSGYGGPANVRDLLILRGADMALINSDVLSYLELAKVLPEARKRVKLIAPLASRGVFLFARRNIKTIEELKGRKIGTLANRPSRAVTAKTVFGLLKISAEFVEADGKELAKRSSEDIDGILLYENDLPMAQSLGITPSSHRLLRLPAAGPLAQAYIPKKLSKTAAGDFSGDEALETVQVATMLAAFDWTPKLGRYTDVVNFVHKFFAVLPHLRTRNPNALASRIDVKAAFPGWSRFAAAEPLVAAAPALPPQKEDAALPLAQNQEAPEGALRLLVVARPPLTNPQAADGGIVLKLLTDALGAAGNQTAIKWVDSEKAMLEGLFTAKSADAGIFWQTEDCESPREQTASEAALCDGANLSEPLMRAVVGVFTRLDASLSSNSGDTTQPRALCVPDNRPVPYQELSAVSWAKASAIKIVRPKSLIDCLAAVDQRQADALIAIEPETRFVIERLKLSQTLQLSQRLDTTAGLHAVVAKDHPRQTQLLQAINDAIAKFRSSDGYAAIMASHLAELTGMPSKAQ